MEVTDIEAKNREHSGKGSARYARRNGKIPAIIYGNHEKNISITIDKYDWNFLVQKPGIFGQLLNINVDKQKFFVLPRDIQFHPVSEETLHIDFLRVTEKSTVNVGINVEFVNDDKCQGLKLGGVLNVVRSQIELMCPATSIPEKIVVDLEGLNVGDAIHISSIKLPDNCFPTITDRDFTVATIAAPRGGMSDSEEEEEANQDEQSTEKDQEAKDSEEK